MRDLYESNRVHKKYKGFELITKVTTSYILFFGNIFDNSLSFSIPKIYIRDNY